METLYVDQTDGCSVLEERLGSDGTKNRSSVPAGGQAECVDTGAGRLTVWDLWTSFC